MEKTNIDVFQDNVLVKYDIYNSLFMSLPFDDVSNTGIFLPLFSKICEQGYKEKQTPLEIVDSFFDKFYEKAISEKEKWDTLFKFIQYIERQVVLFDAIEEASFTKINNLDGLGTLKHLKEKAESENSLEMLKEHLKSYSVRVVLTAHPTQFYPSSVLGIITELSKMIQTNNLAEIKVLLSQLGKTPFFNQSQPTPYDEALRLIWYLENVFYDSVNEINSYLQAVIFEGPFAGDPIKLGFWPGGDRDGNPFVTPETTRKVADKLRSSIITCYYRDVRKLKRRLTFREVDSLVADLENKLYESIFHSDKQTSIKSADYLLESLGNIRNTLISKHHGLYLDEVTQMMQKVRTFGLHFASLDIRQDSRIHHRAILEVIEATGKASLNIFPDNYETLPEEDKIKILGAVEGVLDPSVLNEGIAKTTLEAIYAMKDIQERNGEKACNRYIISNTQSATNIFEVFALMRLCGWSHPSVDIVPLFETIDDLGVADRVMDAIYSDPRYKTHLAARNNKQTIMLGFSDGTKDGGYLMANWAIYTSKERLTAISKRYGIDISFFDGRGGPPARGGGKTHQFYASLGKNIENKHVQLTVQGQTISSNFGHIASCRYNLEQLLSSTLVGNLFPTDNIIGKEDRETIQKLSEISYQAYKDFKNHPCFIPYLEKMSPLKYYGQTKIGSRPTKRGSSGQLVFSDLRAIPFVVSWSSLKQNVPGFFGLGAAMKHFESNGEFHKVQSLYRNSLFFRTLIENAMMSLSKCHFGLTAYMENDKAFGDFWKIIHNEFLTTKALVLKLTGYGKLMENMPSGKASIEVREKIVLPLLTIQQYALEKLHQLNQETLPNDPEAVQVYEKMVTRSLFGNINASRNSA